MNKVLISIIVPVYNAAKYLDKSLASLCNQSMTSLEFICVNDGSKDNSLTVLRSFAEKDKRFVIIDQENQGVSAARNAALSRAQGEFIMFMDSDDWYENNTCERAYNLICQHDADMAMYCMAMEYSDHTEERHVFNEKLITFSGDECTRLQRRCVGLIGEECREINKLDYLSLLYLKIYRRSIIEKKHLHFIDLEEIGSLEDGIFIMEYMSEVKKAVYSDEILYHYNRFNPVSITTRYRPQLQEQWARQFQIINQRICSQRNEFCHALDNRKAYSALTLGLNIVAGNQGLSQQYKDVKKLIFHNSGFKSFLWDEIAVMPKSIAPYFVIAKCKQSLLALCMLKMMQWIRNRRKGIEKVKK